MMAEALANYAARACEKLRKQNSRAQAVYVVVGTSEFSKEQYSNALACALTVPSSDTRTIIEAAKFCLSRIYRPGYRYKKTGVMLLDLIPASLEQKHLFADSDQCPSDHLMAVVDRINRDHGSDTLFFGAQGVHREWKMRCGSRALPWAWAR